MFNKANVALLCFSIVASLYLFELATYFSKTLYYAEHSAASAQRIRAALAQGQQYDTRTRLQFIIDNEAAGKKISPRISPKEFNNTNGLKSGSEQIFPLGSLSNRTTVYCNNYGDYLLFDTDQWGLRNPPLAHQQRQVDTFVVGDSFSFGHCVKDDIGALLRNRGMTSYNAAYGGNGPLIELATIREYGRQLSPKIVLWIYYEGNDLRDFKAEQKSSLLMRYLEPDFSQKIIAKQSQIDMLLERYVVKERAEEIAKTSWPSVIRLTSIRLIFKKSIKQLRNKKVQQNADLALFEQVLTQAQSDVSSWGGQIVFVYLPDWVRFAYPDNFAELNHWLRYRENVLGIAQKLNMPTVDITDELASAPDPLAYYPYKLRGHYTEEGYAILADQITQKLFESGLLNKQLSLE